MNPVYFKNIDDVQRYIGVGEMCSIIHSCYFRAKELGYDKIFIEWPLIVYLWKNDGMFSYCVHCPKETIFFPIIFVEKGTKLMKSIPILGLDKKGMLFEDSDPLIMHDPPPNFPPFEFLNKYFIEHGERPTIHIEKEKQEPYILFHIRKAKISRGLSRNSREEDFIKIFNILKSTYPNYKYYKIGEESYIDSKFDKIFPYYNENINELFKLVNNSTLFIGNSSGPMTLAYMLDIPTIIIEEGNLINQDGIKSPRFKPFWKQRNRKWGLTGYDWLDMDRNLILLRDEEINLQYVNNFSKKFL
jgi:hypothetical protein